MREREKRGEIERAFISTVSMLRIELGHQALLHFAAPDRRMDSQSLSHECSARKLLPLLASVSPF